MAPAWALALLGATAGALVAEPPGPEEAPAALALGSSGRRNVSAEEFLGTETMTLLRAEAQDFPFYVNFSAFATPFASILTPTRSNPKVIWLHIHKAAGTFMCATAKLAHEFIVYPNSNCNFYGGVQGSLSSDMWVNSGHHPDGRTTSCEVRNSRYRPATWGQIEHELWDSDWCPSFMYGTMLRDPMALMQSMVNYDSHGKELISNLWTALESSTTGPTQYSEGIWKMFDNYQVRILANAMSVPAGHIDDSHLATARRRLEQFDVVARLEDLSPQHPLFDALGWGHVRSVVGQRKNHIDLGRRFTESERTRLMQVNKHDYALYRAFQH